MKFRTTIIIAICIALICGAISGCADKTAETTDENEDKLVVTINGRDILQSEFNYIAKQYINELQSEYGVITDWSAELESGVTYEDYILSMTENWFKYAEAIKSQSIRLGIPLNDDDRAALYEQWKNACEEYGGETALLANMAKNGLTTELNDYITEVSYLADKCFVEMYGKNGEKVTNEDCAEKTAEDGYVMIKQIVIGKTAMDADGNKVQLTEEEKAEAKTRAENLLGLLQSAGADGAEAKFEELLTNNNEDPDVSLYPNGYLFQEIDVDSALFDAANALEVGQYSDVVETDTGYHILFRIPVNYDVIPMSYQDYTESDYNFYTLRYIVANSMFSANIGAWIERVEITNTEGFDNMTMADIIAVG